MTRQNNPSQGQAAQSQQGTSRTASSQPSFSTQTYRIYCQAPEQASFRPLDLNTGEQVRNLFYASLVPAKDIVPLIAKLSAWNPDWKFQARKAGGQADEQA